MSRIEKALERAKEMRQTIGQTAGQSPQQQPVPEAARKPESLRQAVLRGEPSIEAEARERLAGQKLLVPINSPRSPEAEEYRKLRENVVKYTRRSTFRNTVMVTSARVGEGKSLTATNLALTMAQDFDHTVLLVDADLRRPACHELLKLEPEVGLSDCLTRGVDIGEALIRTGIGSLVLLPAGKPVPNPAELLSSERMKELLAEMRHRYRDRYIIIDTPPVLPFTEARALSRMVDCAMLVTREGEVSRHDVQDTLEALKETKILGIIYNYADLGGLGARRYSGPSYY